MHQQATCTSGCCKGKRDQFICKALRDFKDVGAFSIPLSLLFVNTLEVNVVADGSTLQMSSSDRVPKINLVASATFRLRAEENRCTICGGCDALF